MAKRVTETELILPSLHLMSLNYGKITTSELNKKLRSIMPIPEDDKDLLAQRKDDKFSQKVRNLKSHNTLDKYATYTKITSRGIYEISEFGKKHLEDNKELLNYLLTNDFNYEDFKAVLEKVESKEKKEKVIAFDENISIIEGNVKIIETKIYQRSRQLRDFAVKYYSQDGKISCKCCQFNFSDVYGEKTGKNFIEIHHIKPIFKYESEDTEKTLQNAMKNLIPVCSNCHKMIHSIKNKPIEPDVLIISIKANGKFPRY